MSSSGDRPRMKRWSVSTISYASCAGSSAFSTVSHDAAKAAAFGPCRQHGDLHPVGVFVEESRHRCRRRRLRHRGGQQRQHTRWRARPTAPACRRRCCCRSARRTAVRTLSPPMGMPSTVALVRRKRCVSSSDHFAARHRAVGGDVEREADAAIGAPLAKLLPGERRSPAAAAPPASRDRACARDSCRATAAVGRRRVRIEQIFRRRHAILDRRQHAFKTGQQPFAEIRRRGRADWSVSSDMRRLLEQRRQVFVLITEARRIDADGAQAGAVPPVARCDRDEVEKCCRSAAGSRRRVRCSSNSYSPPAMPASAARPG